LNAFVCGSSISEWTRSLFSGSSSGIRSTSNNLFSDFNRDMEMSAVNARKSCTKLLRTLYENGVITNEQRGGTFVQVPLQVHPVYIGSGAFGAYNYEQTKHTFHVCNLGTPTISVSADNQFIKPPEMHILLDLLVSAQTNIHRHGLDTEETNQIYLKIRALQNMIHIIAEMGENVILSNINVYDLLEILIEGLREYESENEILTAENVASVMRRRDTAKLLAQHNLEMEIQTLMMRSNQQRHYTKMLVKSQERNQSEEAWHEFTRHYYKVGVKNVEEFTQFGHRLVKVTLYDSIVVLVRGLSSLTYELVYKLLFVICIVILILVLIFRK
jgi:hypothetical protein